VLILSLEHESITCNEIGSVAGFHLLHSAIPHLFSGNMRLFEVFNLFLVSDLGVIVVVLQTLALNQMLLVNLGSKLALPLNLTIQVHSFLNEGSVALLIIVALSVVLVNHSSDLCMELVSSYLALLLHCLVFLHVGF
jgi:hypothetical protein